MRRIRTTAALMLAALSVSACSLGRIDPDFLRPDKREEAVREAADWYSQNLRWGNLEMAAGMVREEDRKAFIERFVRSNTTLRFTDVEIVRVDLGDARDTVDVWVSYEFYQPPSLRQQRAEEHQVWHYDALRGSWNVEPQLDAFPLPDVSGRPPGDRARLR